LAIIGLAIYDELLVCFFRITFHRIFRPGLLVQKSNAGERISKFFVEKKIFYSLDFFTSTSKKSQNDFFHKMVKKHQLKTCMPVNPVTLYWYMFY